MTSSECMTKYKQRAGLDLKDGLAGVSVCRFCGAPREFVTRELSQGLAGLMGFPLGYPLECKCVSKLYEEARKQELIERDGHSYYRRVKDARIPERYRYAETKRALENLYLCGAAGVGKTQTACALLLKALNNGMTALFVTMGWLSGISFEDREIWFERMRKVDVLCIDDLGKAETGEWVNALAFRAIDERYNTKKMLIVTSNYEPSELAVKLMAHSDQRTAQATVSRICEMCHQVPLNGVDRRIA